MSRAKTVPEFLAVYGTAEMAAVSRAAISTDGDSYPVIEVAPDAKGWPSVLVRAGDKAAVVQFMNVGEGDEQHLCIDVHPFVGDEEARASVFGMEVGRRLEAFTDADAAGTSQGFPAAHLVAVLVGAQVETPSPAHVHWELVEGGVYTAAGGWLLADDWNGTWHLTGPENHRIGTRAYAHEAQAVATEHVKAYRAKQRCDAHARKGTGTGVCDAPLDEHGNCPNAGNHLEDK